ncbi:GNAT family N-acetyltransferase [Aquiflexum gelatinilyticum]|uniref:GNAT family N-acetyltransferase n=1 Tax=Aquiflexum gelatinilyticum TaxID=2961943 RepID=UPI003B848BF2
MGNEIGGLFVHPKFQNQRIGKELVQFVSVNFPVLLVEVFAINQEGICFYEKMGFSAVQQKINPETGEILVRMIRDKQGLILHQSSLYGDK